MKRLAFLVAATVLLGAQAPRQQFDLVCEGTRQMQLDGPLQPITQRIRVDLSAGQYCFDACERVMHIAQVTASQIVLSERSTETARQRSSARAEINRVTGEYRNYLIESRPIPTFMETRGTCTPQAFSGFPAARF